MKTRITKFAMAFAATLAFVGCVKEEMNTAGGNNVAEGTEFTLSLTPPTKTANNGLGTEWVAGDKVNVFHAVSGTQDYVNDGAFEYTSGSSFSGKLAGTLDADKAYDWYVAYPYDESMTSPKTMTINIPGDQYQESDGSMAHLAGSLCPLAGKVSGIASGSAVAVGMNHLVTVMKIKVTNYEANPMDLSLVSFMANGCTHENETVNLMADAHAQTITGTFTVDFTGEKTVYTHIDRGTGTGTPRPLLHLNTSEELGLNESATVYLATIPFYIPHATSLTIGMNNNSGGVTQHIYGKNVACKAGQICGVKQGSRLAPPFKEGINFYHGKKNSDGTYTIDNNGWWRCELPADFQLSGEFSFADLFTTCNTGDASISIIDRGNQNDKVGNDGTDEGLARFEALAACCVPGTAEAGGFRWRANRRWESNFNVDYDDKSGVFLHCYAGYNVGAWTIFFRIVDPFDGLIKADGSDILLSTTPTINGGDLWGDKYFAPSANYGGLESGEHSVDICPFINAKPSSWHTDNFNLFHENWTNISVKSADGKELIVNDGHIRLTEYAAKFCRQSAGIKWVPAWFKRWDGTQYHEAAWDNGAAAAEWGISISADGYLKTTPEYTGIGFQFAPSLYFEYDYGYAQHLGTKYLPFLVFNI